MKRDETGKTVTILLVDDHVVVRSGLAAILSVERDFKIVGEASDGHEAVELVAKLKPDVVLMDLMMPEMNGDEATRRICTAQMDSKVLILTTYGTAEEIGRALEAGASGAIMKTVSKQDLFASIRRVAAGERVIGKDIVVGEPEPPIDLSPRQREVLESVTRGLSNADIAKQLGISPSAVKLYLSAVFEKLGAASRAEAVAIALKRQLLKL